jgi:hypothetical protein
MTFGVYEIDIMAFVRFFVISLISMCTIGFQNYLFSASAASLTHKLRSLSFRAILRQDSKHIFHFT